MIRYGKKQWGPGDPRGQSAPTTLNPPYDFVGYPYDYLGFAENGTGTIDFGSPVDLRGGIQVALDHRGQPTYQTTQPIFSNDALVAQPYELDLSPKAPRGTHMNTPDAPFSLPELERLLRPFDIDTMNLPDRLERLAPGLMATATDSSSNKTNHHRKVTTESWDIASTPCAVTPEILQDLAAERTTLPAAFIDSVNTPPLPTIVMVKKWLDQFPPGIPRLFAARLVIGGPDPDDGYDPDVLPANFKTILEDSSHVDLIPGSSIDDLIAPEMMAGLPLDLNSRFTPRDTPANKIINTRERQAMARQLYILAMLLTNSVPLSNPPVTADLTYLDKIAWQTFTDTEPATIDEKRQYTARLLAQWAINVVDFRCNDSIMTPFEYDEKPFEGAGTSVWSVDNDPATDTEPDRGLVWGATRPELLITETLAFHDRRTEDTDTSNKTTDTTPDDDFDQRHRPQGSLFIELYNPGAANEAVPADLANSSGEGIDLVKRVIDPSDPSIISPAWRIAVVTRTDTETEKNAGDGLEEANRDPDSETDAPTVERSVFFTKPSFAAGNEPDTSVKYYPDSAPPANGIPLKSGRYALIGPPNERAEGTFIGTKGVSDPLTGTLNDPGGTRRIQLTPNATNVDASNQVLFYPAETIAAANNETVASMVNTSILQPVAMTIDKPFRLSISEPTGGYAAPDHLTIPNAYAAVKDMPEDKRTQSNKLWPAKIGDDRTFWTTVLSKNGTVLRFAVLHLQRLADPTQPFHKDTNPYRTVDSMPVDLTTFNGLEDTPGGDEGAPVGEGANKFFTRERGELNGKVLWKQEPWGDTNKPNNTPAINDSESHKFNDKLGHSLGYLSRTFGPPLDNMSGAPTTYFGSPQTPFPWLNWNNRPYMSKNELALVPCASSSRLLQCYGLQGSNLDSYVPTAPTADAVADRLTRNFPHLPNLFNSGMFTPGPPNTIADATELHRVLDYVRVASRFTRTREPITGTTQLDEQYREITDQREPGRVNLNTIFDNSDCVSGGVKFGLTEANLVRSRWGNVDLTDTTKWAGGILGTVSGMYNASPTRVPNPFRSARGLGMVPTVELMEAVDREVNATLFRGDGGTPPSPVFGGTSANPYDDATRNPYFKYLPLTRLGNITGTRSNVYAVWVTVGYFEVEPATINSVVTTAAELAKIYPDGVRIGQEVGADSGEVKRNRAFYIIDRSIPVGFKRGKILM